MNLFDRLVDEAVRNRPDLALLRPVVEKELLHHDILREMSEAGLLSRLAFIGGTCLRACYGSERLSEDLDFTGGFDFDPRNLSDLAPVLVKTLQEKYGLPVRVREPIHESGNVDTWKLLVQTRPERPDLPSQRIHIDICAIPSHDIRPQMLLNPYRVDMGTSGLILKAQSREEIYADKFVAFALRPNRLKNRDLWDIAWLKQQTVRLDPVLIAMKLEDRSVKIDSFMSSISIRLSALGMDGDVHKEFRNEMKRFLPSGRSAATALSADFWQYLGTLVSEECHRIITHLKM